MIDLYTLTDGVVSLRPLGADDASFLVAACADEEIQRFWIPTPPTTLDEAHSDIERFTEAWRTFESIGRPDRVGFSICDSQTDQLLGFCDVEWSAIDSVELGYWLAGSARGRGAATRAVLLVTGWVFGFGAARVYLTMDAANERSVALARRAGFVFEGVLRSHGMRNGRRYDMAWFSVLPDEWAARRVSQ